MTDGRDYTVEGNDTSGYIGVSPEYMTYANETEKPLLTAQEEWDYTHNLDHLEGNADEDVEKETEEESEVESEVKTESETQEVKKDSGPVITGLV